MRPLRQDCIHPNLDATKNDSHRHIDAPDREGHRHSAIESLQILNTLPEDAYERIVRRVSEFFAVPVCLISFADHDRLWFKAKLGIQIETIPRDESFCEAALEAGDLFVMPDTLTSPRFREHPFVTGAPHIRFYAGMPLRLDDGALVGTLCIIDTNPHVFGERESDALKDFAALVVDELHLRLRTLTLETELRRQQAAEASALARQKERADFLAMVTHEVRAPLNAIAGMVSLICEGAPRTFHDVDVEALRGSSEHLVRMINEVLDLAKLEATGFTFNREAFDLRRELRCALAIVRPQLEANGVALDMQVDDDVPAFVVGDRTRVSQIVLNLLGNAAKFTSQGSVTLSVFASAVENGRVPLELRVRDTGIGMDPEAARHLFTGFTQADPEVRARYGGTGLGLAICQKLVHAMGGKLPRKAYPARAPPLSARFRSNSQRSRLARPRIAALAP